VFAPGGEVLHAEAEARADDQRLALSAAVRGLAQSQARYRTHQPDRVVQLWNALISGRWSLVHTLDTDGKRLLVARRNTLGLASPATLNDEERQVAALVSRGHSPTLIAYELGLSPSTVSERLQRALRKLGMRSKAELVRLLNDGRET
jgi:DNA-binding NarL/FixJ family response regulator